MQRVAFLLSLVVPMILVGCNEPRYRNRTLSSWTYDLEQPDDYKVTAACEALGAMGPAAAPAVPKLVEKLEDSNPGVRSFAEVALAKIGADSIPALEQALKKPHPAVRLHAGAALVTIRPDHVAGGEALARAATGVGNAELAKQAQDLLIKRGAPMVQHLIPYIDDPYAPVRLQVLRTLGRMGKNAAPAVEGITDKVKSGATTEIRVEAMRALSKIADRATVEPILRELLEEEDTDVANNAGALLQYIGARESATGFEGEGEGQADAGTAQKTPKKRRKKGKK